MSRIFFVSLSEILSESVELPKRAKMLISYSFFRLVKSYFDIIRIIIFLYFQYSV